MAPLTMCRLSNNTQDGTSGKIHSRHALSHLTAQPYAFHLLFVSSHTTLLPMTCR